MAQAQAVVTPGSKEASTAKTAGEKQLDTYSPRLRLVRWNVPVSEMRYGTSFASKEMMRGRLEPNGGERLHNVQRIARYVKIRSEGMLSFGWSTQKRQHIESRCGQWRWVRRRDAQLQAAYSNLENTH